MTIKPNVPKYTNKGSISPVNVAETDAVSQRSCWIKKQTDQEDHGQRHARVFVPQ